MLKEPHGADRATDERFGQHVLSSFVCGANKNERLWALIPRVWLSVSSHLTALSIPVAIEYIQIP